MPKILKIEPICSIDDWFRLAPPKKGELQWVDGRSAKELAKAWFTEPGQPSVPAELRALLDSHEQTRGAVIDEGEPERLTRFDTCGGEPRNADLVLWGHVPDENKIAVSIEAKADESFGDITGEYADRSIARNPRSRVPERFALLCEGLFGLPPQDEALRSLRYQLFTAVAGALVEAQNCGAKLAVMVVHEFLGCTQVEKVSANADDLDRFVRLLSRGTIDSIHPGTLAGPFDVPGNKHFEACQSLFIGKCRRIVQQAT